MATTAGMLDLTDVTIAQPLTGQGMFGVRHHRCLNLDSCRNSVALPCAQARDIFASRVPRAASASQSGTVTVPPLSDAGPFFLDPGVTGGAASASSSLPPMGRSKRFVAGSRLAKARQAALARSKSARPRKDEETWTREVSELKEAAAKAEDERKAMRVKLVKAEKEASKLQKLVGDVLIEQTPSAANQFRKIGVLNDKIQSLKNEADVRGRQIKTLQADSKVAATRKLRDDVTAYQVEVSRLRRQLEERTIEANENAQILKRARQKLAKHTQRTVVQTRRQTERVVAARHSADLEALAKQSKLLKKELKNMQHKDWVMECARLEGMLQEAFRIVKHVEGQRAESLEHQREMREAVLENEHALEAEVAAHQEERKRASMAERERDAVAAENSQLHQQIKTLEAQLHEAERDKNTAKDESRHAETLIRTMRQYPPLLPALAVSFPISIWFTYLSASVPYPLSVMHTAISTY